MGHKTGERSQEVCTSCYIINKSYLCNIQHTEYGQLYCTKFKWTQKVTIIILVIISNVKYFIQMSNIFVVYLNLEISNFVSWEKEILALNDEVTSFHLKCWLEAIPSSFAGSHMGSPSTHLWWSMMEDNERKRIYICMYDWVTLLYSRKLTEHSKPTIMEKKIA